MGGVMMTGGAMIVAVMAGVVMTGSCGAMAGAAMVRRGGIRGRRSRAGGIGMTIVGATDGGRMGAAATMADRRRCLAAPRRLRRVIASLSWMADRREVGVEPVEHRLGDLDGARVGEAGEHGDGG